MISVLNLCTPEHNNDRDGSRCRFSLLYFVSNGVCQLPAFLPSVMQRFQMTRVRMHTAALMMMRRRRKKKKSFHAENKHARCYYAVSRIKGRYDTIIKTYTRCTWACVYNRWLYNTCLWLSAQRSANSSRRRCALDPLHKPASQKKTLRDNA